MQILLITELSTSVFLLDYVLTYFPSLFLLVCARSVRTQLFWKKVKDHGAHAELRKVKCKWNWENEIEVWWSLIHGFHCSRSTVYSMWISFTPIQHTLWGRILRVALHLDCLAGLCHLELPSSKWFDSSFEMCLTATQGLALGNSFFMIFLIRFSLGNLTPIYLRIMFWMPGYLEGDARLVLSLVCLTCYSPRFSMEHLSYCFQ